MSRISELRLKDQIFVRSYRWRHIDPVPWSPLQKPLAECRLGLVSSAGLSAPGQEGFDVTKRGGDPGFREIPTEINVQELIENHRSQSWDHQGVEQDKNLAFPIDRAKELVETGRIESLSGRQLSFMGSITAPGRFVRDFVPQAAEVFVEEEVDVALLAPV